MNNKQLVFNFKFVKAETIEELKYNGVQKNDYKCCAYEYLHNSGAKLLYLENDDPEKSFTIGFKTLPKDSTGVFHILEHSVLCGSKKFPVKEPFTNLLKSSMQTFLNAMTFPDKTIYPVASTNEKDLYNLIDVYMDAVLFPNIYKNKNIFYQEGRHKTIDGFSGVVYNEMQGVYSDPQEHIIDGLMKSLFPQSCYAYSSGGSPEVIKTLTYEEYLKQHNTNYNLNNAFIIVYGDLNIKKMLKFLDENYLSCSNKIAEWRNNIGECNQGKFESNFDKNKKIKPLKIEVETNKENAECGAAFVLERNHKKIIATKILINALCSSNESPLKKALLAEKFASDIDFDFLYEVYQPFVFAECRGSKKDYSDKIIETIKEKMNKILANGIPKKLLNAAISNLEFILKEKIPSFTNGIDASISIFSEWLYNKDASTEAIKYIEDIKWLKQKVNTNFFDDLAKEIFINNKHIASVEVVPVDKLPQKKVAYEENELKKIKTLNETLNKWQSTPDRQEDEKKIPSMKKEDITEIIEYPKWNLESKNIDILYYEINTNEITYVNRYYPLNGLNQDDLFYVSVLNLLLGKLDTNKYSSSEIDVITQEKLGTLNFETAFVEKNKNIDDIEFLLCIKSAALNQNAEYLAWFVDEIIHNTKFENTKIIETILNQKKIIMEQDFIANGHNCAMNYAASGILPIYWAYEFISGIEFYKKLKDTLKNFDKNKNILINKLKDVANTIFSNYPTISYAGENIINKINFDNSKNCKGKLQINYKCNNNKTAILIPSNVNYCACVNDIRLENLSFNGCDIAASKIIGLDYLWNEVRVKNGAYGAGMIVSINGLMRYYSYRDPKILETFNNYNTSANWLKDLSIDSAKLDNYIISTIAKYSAPIPTRNIIAIQDKYYFSKIDPGIRKTISQEILQTTIEDIKLSADKFSTLTNKANLCVFGGPDIKQLEKQGFKIIDLFND